MRTGVVIVRDVLRREAPKVPLREDHHVIEALPPDTPQQPLADRVGLGCLNRCSQQANARPFRDLYELMTILVVVVANEKAWSLVKRGDLAQLLRDSGIGG